MKDKVVNSMPLTQLWDTDGPIGATRKRFLSRDELKALLSQHRIEFVVANLGHPLKWIPVDECFSFWKSEVKPHLVSSPDGGFSLEDFSYEYAYVASEWSGEFQHPVVLLEMHH